MRVNDRTFTQRDLACYDGRTSNSEIAMDASESPAAALDGLRIIDLSRDVAGAYAARLLADLGAHVLRVEPPAGAADGVSLEWLHAGKRSATIDLTRDDGAALLRALVLDFDVLIDDRPPGELDGLGLGYEALAAVKPRLVYVSVTPFGVHGPSAGRAATDAELFAAAGLDGVACGPYAARLRAGLHAFAATLTAVYSALVKEVGHQVEIATIETLAATLPPVARAVSSLPFDSAQDRPFALSGAPVAAGGRAPSLGEHTEEVLFGELELDPEEFARLRAEGVV